jgi:Rubisco LSMT substrate-binding
MLDYTAHPRSYDAVMGEHLSPRGSRNAALLAALEQLTGGPPALVLTARGPDVTCRAALRAGLASDAELVRAGWRSGAGAGDVGLCARVMGRLSTPTSLPTERRLLSVLAAAVAACMAAYPTTAEADAAELAAAAAALGPDEMSAPLEARVRVGVLRALLSEKAALAGAARAVTAWSEHLDELAASGASPSAEDLAAVYGDDEDDAM